MSGTSYRRPMSPGRGRFCCRHRQVDLASSSRSMSHRGHRSSEFATRRHHCGQVATARFRFSCLSGPVLSIIRANPTVPCGRPRTPRSPWPVRWPAPRRCVPDPLNVESDLRRSSETACHLQCRDRRLSIHAGWSSRRTCHGPRFATQTRSDRHPLAPAARTTTRHPNPWRVRQCGPQVTRARNAPCSLCPLADPRRSSTTSTRPNSRYLLGRNVRPRHSNLRGCRVPR